jgi:hypothetical protein
MQIRNKGPCRPGGGSRCNFFQSFANYMQVLDYALSKQNYLTVHWTGDRMLFLQILETRSPFEKFGL